MIAVLGTWLARRYALRRRLLDAPGVRRSHAVATPRGGGAAIVVAVLPVFAWMTWQDAGRWPLAVACAAGLAMVAGIGWLDDHRPLSPWLRLTVHVVAAGMLAASLLWLGNPLWWAACMFALAVGLVNVWNFMDGINGIATTQAMLVALAAPWLGLPWILPLVVLVACCGFLPFNFPRARIFLGDVGSGSLGWLVACLFAWLPGSSLDAALLLMLPLSAFLVDATLTLLSRMLRRERWWTAHVQHVYQRLVHRGRSHVAVTVAYGLWTLLAILVLWLFAGRTTPAIIGVLAAWYLLTATTWFVFRVRLQAASATMDEAR